MPIQRAPKTGNPHTAILNAALRDDRLTWKARGLLAFILTHPDNWTINLDWLTRQGPDGATATRSAMKELEQAGYLRREKTQVEAGRWTTVVHVTETPETGHRQYGNRPVGDRHVGERAAIHKTVTKTVKNPPTPRTKSTVNSDQPEPKSGSSRKASHVKDAADRAVAAWLQATEGNTAQSPNELHRLATVALTNGTDEDALVRAIKQIVDDGQPVKDFRITQALNGRYKTAKDKTINYAADRPGRTYDEDLTAYCTPTGNSGYSEDL